MLKNLRVIPNWGRAGLISFYFSPIRLAYKGFLLCSKAMGELFRPARAPGSLKEPAPPGSLGLQSLVPRPKVKSQKCQKNPKCQKHHKIFFERFLLTFFSKAQQSKATQSKAKQSKAQHSKAK